MYINYVLHIFVILNKENMDSNDLLLTPLQESSNNINPITGLSMFVRYINILEGYKTKIKNLHWAASAMNIHIRLDEMLDIVSDFQDSIAEEAMGIYGQMGSNVISGTPCECVDALMMLESLKQKTIIFYKSLQDKVEYAGIKSETETFMHNINKYLYLFRLCKG